MTTPDRRLGADPLSPVVAGLDISKSSTGLALLGQQLEVSMGSGGHRGHTDDSLVVRYQQMAQTVGWVERMLPASTRLVVVEAPAYGAVGGAAHDRAGLWWVIVGRCLATGLPVATVAPATLKKYATGAGRAEKFQVTSAVRQRFGVTPGTPDEADALVLAWMGADRLGWLAGEPEFRAQALQAGHWPDPTDSLDKGRWAAGA